MTLAFRLDQIQSVEFGIGKDREDGRDYWVIPVDAAVQAALVEMTRATWRSLLAVDGGPARYEPSDKHGSIEYLFLPLNDVLSTGMRELHHANNIAISANALADRSQVFAYFARMTDTHGHRLTALRRATQFKGILRNRLIRLVTNALKFVEDDVFKLDSDFDVLVDNNQVHILRPSAFEFAGQLQQAVMDAVPTNIATLNADLPFVAFAAIGQYAAQHPRAARYLASIRAADETKNINKRKLKALCKRTGVVVNESNGQLQVDDSNVMGFLEVLDRRRYELELVSGQRESYRAPSRQRLKQ